MRPIIKTTSYYACAVLVRNFFILIFYSLLIFIISIHTIVILKKKLSYFTVYTKHLNFHSSDCSQQRHDLKRLLHRCIITVTTNILYTAPSIRRQMAPHYSLLWLK